MPRKANPEPVTRTEREKRPNGDTYIWEKTTQYDPALRRVRTLSKKLLGKIPAGSTEMVETRYKAPANPDKVYRNNIDEVFEKLNKMSASSDSDTTPDNPNSVAENSAVDEGTQTTEYAGQATRRRKTNWYAVCKHTDMMSILDFCGRTSGIDKALNAACSDAGTAQKIISMARFLTATDGDALTKIETWQLNHPLPYSDRINDSVCADLFVKLGNDDRVQQKYFSIEAQKLPSQTYLAYDIAAHSTYQRHFAVNIGNTVKALVLYSEDSGRPVACTMRQNGISEARSINSALRPMRFLNKKSVELIEGNGFYSPQNVAALSRDATHYIMPIPSSIDWVRTQIDAHRAELNWISTACPYEKTLHGVAVPVEQAFRYMSYENGEMKCEDVPAQLYLHIYYDSAKASAANTAFESRLYEMREMLLAEPVVEALSPADQRLVNTFFKIRFDKRKGGGCNVEFNHEACEEFQNYQGFFCLISDNEADPFEALKKYRRREIIENIIEMGDGYDDPRGLRGQSEEALIGRLFVQFIALSYREYYATLAENAKKTLEERLNSPEASKDDVGKYKRLLAWINTFSPSKQLAWFDARETIEEHRDAAALRWNADTFEQDKCYLKLLGM